MDILRMLFRKKSSRGTNNYQYLRHMRELRMIIDVIKDFYNGMIKMQEPISSSFTKTKDTTLL